MTTTNRGHGSARIQLVCSAALALMGCASSQLDARVAQLEQELKAARTMPTVTRPLSPGEVVATADRMTAASPAAYVVFVDERPKHCNGALCLEVVNRHPNPALLEINGQPAAVVGPMGELLPPGGHGFVRLTNPGEVTVTYTLYDTVSFGDRSSEIPVATALSRCRIRTSVGSVYHAEHGGKSINLTPWFCDR